ncbi:MAG: hypothetical protein AABW45_01220 [Nanoarchaeota archaeon]
METLSISKEKFSKILEDFEVLINDVESALSEENLIVRKRMNEIKLNPSIGKTEQELDDYLKKRGVM